LKYYGSILLNIYDGLNLKFSVFK